MKKIFLIFAAAVVLVPAFAEFDDDTDTIDYEYGNKIDEDGYKHAIELESWFNKAILDTDYWEDGMEMKLSTHIIKNWFGIK